MILRNIFAMSLLLTICSQGNVAFAAKKNKGIASYEVEDCTTNLSFSFTPPKKWQCVTDKEGLPAKVEAVYIGNGSNGFNPSINIATEETELSLEEYVKIAKHYHEKQPQTKCHLLGTYICKAGEMELLQIEQNTSWGEVRFLQAAFVHDKEAYVITATCLEKDYSEYYPKFLQSLQTFNLTAQPKQKAKGNHD